MSDQLFVFSAGTPSAVQKVLADAYHSGQRLRLFLGDQKTGKPWLEEFDVAGTIGRSTGPQHIPLLIPNRRSSGGGGILTACIVRIQAGHHVLYEHPKFKFPEIEIQQLTSGELVDRGYRFRAVVDGNDHANFKSKIAAERWRKFMLGERGSK